MTARGRSGIGAVLLRELRPHQWSKNALVAVAPVMAHDFLRAETLRAIALAALALSLLASAVYVMNDLVDLETDRKHARKRMRPIAAGELSVGAACALGAALAAAGLALAFGAVAVASLGVNLAYSLFLKSRLLVDVLALSALYVLRIVAGGAAAAVPVSDWLLGFSLFFFLSLALVKRYTEAVALPADAAGPVAGRGYRRTDAEVVLISGTASAYTAALVLALYITSPRVRTLYAQPDYLWLLCPLVIYWLSRIWFLAHRGDMHHDPVFFALTDRTSYLVGLAALVVLALATGV